MCPSGATYLLAGTNQIGQLGKNEMNFKHYISFKWLRENKIYSHIFPYLMLECQLSMSNAWGSFSMSTTVGSPFHVINMESWSSSFWHGNMTLKLYTWKDDPQTVYMEKMTTTWRVSYKRQWLLGLREHMGSFPIFGGVRVAYLLSFPSANFLCLTLEVHFPCLQP
jgi:hypothetical protein